MLFEFLYEEARFFITAGGSRTIQRVQSAEGAMFNLGKVSLEHSRNAQRW